MRMFVLFAALLVQVASLTLSASADEIRVEGGGTAIATVFEPIKEQFEKKTGHRLTIIRSTPVKGLIALDKGMVEVATGAHPLEDLLASVARDGVKIDTTSLVETVVAQSQTLAFVHKANGVKRLTKEELKGIFTGRITNWQAVGGDDREIVVVWGEETPGQNAHFTRAILDGEPVTSKAKMVTDYWGIRAAVSGTAGAIGICPAGLKTISVNTPEIPGINSQIMVFTKGKPSATVQQLLDFYTEEFGFLNP